MRHILEILCASFGLVVDYAARGPFWFSLVILEKCWYNDLNCFLIYSIRIL